MVLLLDEWPTAGPYEEIYASRWIPVARSTMTIN